MSRPLVLAILGLLALAAATIPLVGFILITLVLLSTVVVVHEFSHLVTARLLGVRVLAFGLGFGPQVGMRRWRDIDWKLRAFPIGGYVSMTGEGPDADEGAASYARAGRLRRAIIALAGPTSNLLLAWLLLWLLLFGHGVSPVSAAGRGIEMLAQLGEAIVTAIAGWLPLAVSDPLDMPFSGLPGMVESVGILSQGDDPLVMLGLFTAAISFSIGLFNLLPLPPLDGGHLLVDLIAAEPQSVAPWRLALRARLERYGVACLLVFIGLVTAIDLVRVISGYEVAL